jgi:DNA-binding transcriptional MerR regulator
MDGTWTLADLVAEAAARLEALPAPKNGQVRAVPDERTIRYYATIGLLDRPAAMRGRTALYGARHLAQVVAIKRMQSAGHSLADIQAMWPTLDDVTLARMSGVQLAGKAKAARKEFWKREPEQVAAAREAAAEPSSPAPPRVRRAPTFSLVVTIPDSVSLTPADVRALRAAAAPLIAELAKRGLNAHVLGTLEEEP